MRTPAHSAHTPARSAQRIASAQRMKRASRTCTMSTLATVTIIKEASPMRARMDADALSKEVEERTVTASFLKDRAVNMNRLIEKSHGKAEIRSAAASQAASILLRAMRHKVYILGTSVEGQNILLCLLELLSTTGAMVLM